MQIQPVTIDDAPAQSSHRFQPSAFATRLTGCHEIDTLGVATSQLEDAVNAANHDGKQSHDAGEL